MSFSQAGRHNPDKIVFGKFDSYNDNKYPNRIQNGFGLAPAKRGESVIGVHGYTAVFQTAIEGPLPSISSQEVTNWNIAQKQSERLIHA